MINYAAMRLGDEVEMPRRDNDRGKAWEGLNQAEFAACQAYARAHAADRPAPQFEVAPHTFNNGVGKYGFMLRRIR